MGQLIYRYDLPEEAGKFELRMPHSADILHVANVGDRGAMWAAVSDSHETEVRRFESIVTGGKPPENGDYLGTYVILNGRVAIHVFEFQVVR